MKSVRPLANKPSQDPAHLLSQGLARLDLELGKVAQHRLLKLVELLEHWGRVYNLTAVRGTAAMVSQHLLDSLSILPHLQGSRILDLGTGAGFPGLPLAIVQSDWRFVLLDSNAKKTRFVQQAVSQLGLDNCQVVTSRIERFQPTEPFDEIVSRAFASLRDTVERCQHLLHEGAILSAMKGQYPGEELDNLPVGVQVIAVYRLEVPDLDRAERHLVQLRGHRLKVVV